MRYNCIAIIVLAILPLAGCDVQKALATPQEEAVAKGCLDQLKRGQWKEIERRADPSIKTDGLPQLLVRMAALIPSGEPLSVALVGDNHVSTPSFQMVNLTYEFRYPDRWLLENVAIKTEGGKSTLIGLNVVPIARSLEEQHRFDLVGKSTLEYAYLALAIFMPLFTVVTLVVCARTPLKGRKWPWIVFILFGVGAFSVNWATGQANFYPIMITLFSAGVITTPLGPWIVSFSLPIGALIFLVRRRALMVKAMDGSDRP